MQWQWLSDQSTFELCSECSPCSLLGFTPESLHMKEANSSNEPDSNASPHTTNPKKISNSIHTNLDDKQVCQRGRYVSELNIKGSWATMAQPPWNPWNPRRHLTSDFIHPWFVIHQKNGNSTILHLLCHWSANYMTFFISSILRVQYSTCTTWIILQFSIKCYITYHTTTPI